MALVTDKLVYVHIYKTGGNSVRKLLPQEGKEVGGVHSCLKDVQASYKSDMPNHFKFAVVRHPYDWTYSLYTYIRRTNHGLRPIVLKQNFVEFIVYLRDHMLGQPWKHLGNNVTTMTVACEGCDKFYKLEDLKKDTTQFCKDVGVRYQPLPLVNNNPDNNIPYFLEADILIQDIFADDYKTFGYE